MRIDCELVGLMEEEKRSLETEGKRRNKNCIQNAFRVTFTLLSPLHVHARFVSQLAAQREEIMYSMKKV